MPDTELMLVRNGKTRTLLRKGRALLSDQRRVDSLVLALALLCATLVYLNAYWDHPVKPRIAAQGQGWWYGHDQWKYLQSTLAFAQGNLEPGYHTYLPGYSLLATPFVHLTQANPFLIPDLVCLLASLWISGHLMAELMPGWRWGRITGFLVFLATSVLFPLTLDVWVVPWTTTFATPMVLLCLWSLLKVIGTERPFVYGGIAGLAGCLVAAARPIDAAVVLGTAGGVTLVSLLWQRRALSAPVYFIVGGIAGSLIALTVMLIPYLAVYGLRASDYMVVSSRIGFDWRLLPARWVAIVISPLPMFADAMGRGLAERIPWIPFGFAGMVACLVFTHGVGARLRHLVVISATVMYFLLYLTYRDLLSDGLWRFHNYHYFKWNYLIFGFYTFFLVHMLVVSSMRLRLQVAATALAVIVLLFSWRIQLEPTGNTATKLLGPASIEFSEGLKRIDEGMVVPAVGPWAEIFYGRHSMTIGGTRFGWGDYKLTPYPGGFTMTPLRTLPAGPAVLTFERDVTFIDRPVVTFRERLVFGLPCWFARWVPACAVALPLAPVTTHMGETVALSDPATRALTEGYWGDVEESGRWTIGTSATLFFVVDPPKDRDILLTMNLKGFTPPKAELPLVSVIVNGSHLADWTIEPGEQQSKSLVVPARLIPADGHLIVNFRIANPLMPKAIYPGSTDDRPLGVFLRTIRFDPAS